MSNTNRRRFIGRGAAAAAAVMAAAAPAAAQERPAKKIYGRRPTQAGAKPPLFNSVVSYGNLVFIAGVGAHYEGDIKAHTKTVLDQIQKNLESAGSSMEKVLKCNVYLNDLKDYAGMNGLRPPAAFRATHWSRSTWSDIFDEAWVTGGNYVMSLGTRLRDALLKGIPDALAAWRTPRPGRS